MTRPTKMSRKQALVAAEKILAANGIEKVPDAYLTRLLTARDEHNVPLYFPMARSSAGRGTGYSIVDDGNFEARLLYAIENNPHVPQRARVDTSEILKPKFNP